MEFSVGNAAKAAALCVVVLLGACKSDPDFKPDADFVAFSHDVSEVSLGALEKPTDARLREYSVLPSLSGAAVLLTISRKEEGNIFCCRSVRLTDLDGAGAIRSERNLVSQPPGTHGLTVLPLRLDARSIELAVVEERLVQLNPDDRYKTRLRQVSLASFQRDGTEVERKAALELPIGVVVENGWTRGDGMTVLAGTQATGGEIVAWVGVLNADGTLAWQKPFPELPRALEHAHDFTDDDRLVLHARAPRWTDRGVAHILSRRTIDLASGEVSDLSMFDLPRSRLSDSALGKVRPVFDHAASLPDGDQIVTMTGWYQGKFEKLRVSRISAGGKIQWITVLNEGPGKLIPQMAVDRNGEIAVTGSDSTSQVLYRLSADGKLIAQHRVRDASIKRIKAHPDGGYLFWVQVETGERRKKMRLLRVKAWPAE